MKKNKKHIGLWIGSGVSIFLTVILTVANILGQTALFELFSTFFGKRSKEVFGPGIYYESDYEDKEDAFIKSNLLNETINEEGITMLKNEGNCLPLAKGNKISVFGKNSVNLAYGGSGSGAFTVDETTPTIYQALDEAGFEYNKTLKEFYDNNSKSGEGRKKNPTLDNGRSTVSGFGTGETPYSKYTKDVTDSYKKYNDAALVVITRIGGESFDLPRTMKDVDGAYDESDHYLELDKNEQDLLVNVCANFDKVILIINSSTSLELGFLDDIEDNDSTLVDGMKGISSKIKGALWIGGPGYSGILALGRVLNGTVTPSGKTIDTYQRDFTKDPTYQNFADQLVNNGNTYLVSDGSKPSVSEHYVDYEESIYVGYRYYETRGKDNADWYKNNVVFPFGYGLSYTTFDWNLKSMNFTNNEEITIDPTADKEFEIVMNVKNTGSTYSGKDVVEVYITAPYVENGIEKPYVSLVGFAKTPLLAPGEDKDVTINFSAYDFASYDYSDANKNNFKGYELDAGTYEVKVMRDAHNVVTKQSFKLNSGVKYEKDTTTNYEVKNLYDDVSFEKNYGMESLLSRNNWDGTFPVNEVLNGSNAERTVSPEFMAKIKSTDTNNPIVNDSSVQMPEVADAASPAGEKNLYELIQFDENEAAIRDAEGTIIVDYNDERWEEYLSILTGSEMMNYCMKGAFKTDALPSVGALDVFCSDGPVGFVYFMAATEATNPVYKTCSYASECVIAATWNVDLAYEMGKSVGNEGLIGNVRADGRPYTGWYAPAVNIHRTPFSGRNFEYYSEDPFISGKLAAAVIKGARSKGVYCNLKHFAVNDQETNRSGVCTWLSEQALREIYLKPFEIAVKEGGALALMSSFNRIGSLWTGGDYRLLTTILRNEWGFQGLVITDFNTEPFMNTKQMTYAGGDLNLATTPALWTPTTAADYTVLRQATKNILYVTARSNAMNGCGEGCYYITYYAWWEVTFLWVCIGLFAVSAGLVATTIILDKKAKKKEQ